MREWLVIESSMKNAVFADPELRDKKGYIPRDAAEKLLGRSLDGTQWFTREDDEKMRSHPEWRDTEPENAMTEPTSPAAQTPDRMSKAALVRAFVKANKTIAAKEAEIARLQKALSPLVDPARVVSADAKEPVTLHIEVFRYEVDKARAALQPQSPGTAQEG